MSGTGASCSALGYHRTVAATETLRVVLDAGNATRRLDELSTARVILKIAEQVHASQQKAGAGKSIGPLTPSSITIDTATGAVKLGLAEPTAFAYAAPEQLGVATADGDRRSDVWSLGVVMWEALTHTTLFEGGDDEAVKAAVRLQTIDPPATLNANIPSELSAICMRALARNPADRYQTAKVMGAELEAVLDDAGYGDSDDKIREHMATLGQPKREPRITAPPMVVTPGQGVGVISPETTQPTAPPEMLTPPPGNGSSTSPGMVIPRGDQAPVKSPATPITVTRSANGTQPPPTVEQPLSPTSFSKPTTMPPPVATATLPSVLAKPPTAPPPIADATKGANLASALANAAAPAKPDRMAITTMVSAAIPMPQPPQIPKPPILPPATPAQTAHGFHSDQVAKPTDDFRVTQVAAMPAPPPVVIAEIPSLVSAPVGVPRSEKRTDPTPMAEIKKRAGTNPDPAAVIALPAVRDSQGVLGGWGWGTDSHPSITDANDDDLPAEGSSKKILMYVIGGGLGVVAIVITLAFAFGGSNHEAAKPRAKMTGSGSAEIAYGSGVEYGSATGDPTGGSAAVAAASGSGSGAGSETGSNVAAVVVPTDAAVVAIVSPPVVVPDAAPDAAPATVAIAPPPLPRPPVVKPKPPTPVIVAKPIEKKPEKKPEPSHRVDKPVEKAKPIHIAEGPTATAKADAEASYRQGVQQFARGDTSGALTSLRTALASNPGYAPTWRGLGLVFEKMGEKDQAKAAFKRYLQLSPAATDGDQIRNRMERL